MSLIALGLSHQTAPLELREQVAVSPERVQATLQKLLAEDGFSEAVLLCTCNRTEFYCRTGDESGDSLRSWICSHFDIAGDLLEKHHYLHTEQDAASHLIRVASGLDSMIVGEPQILGQVKESFRLAESSDAVGPILRAMFDKAFSASKVIRSNTSVGEHSVSVASIAVLLAKQVFGNLQEKTVLLVGAGEMIEICLRYLLQHGVSRILVANRNIENAQKLTNQFQGEAMALDQLPDRLAAADVIISSTGSPDTIVSQQMMQKAIRQRRHQPVIMIDIAVPRDIDPDISSMSDVYLYTIDDLQDLARENMNRRAEAANAAETLVTEKSGEFIRWCHGQRAVHGIRQMRTAAQQGNQQLIDDAVKRLAAGQDGREVIEHLTRSLSNKILHGPSTRLREAAENQDFALLAAARQLFVDPAAEEDEE